MRDRKINKQLVDSQIIFIPNSIDKTAILELVHKEKEEINQQAKRMENQE
jgi:hypothetical protein